MNDRIAFVPYDKAAIQEAAVAFVLHRGEERSLKRLLAKSPEAKECMSRLCELATPFIRILGDPYRRCMRAIEMTDIYQAGYIGLMVSAINYELDSPAQFVTYARYSIRAKMQKIDNACNTPIMHVKGNSVTNHKKYAMAESHLKHKLRRQPNLDEIAEVAALPAMDLQRVRMALNTHEAEPCAEYVLKQSVAAPTVRDNPFELFQRLAVRQALFKALDVLAKRYRRVLTVRYGLDDMGEHTLEETSEIISREEGHRVCRERIRQLEAKAFEILRRNSDSCGLAALMRDMTDEPAENFVLCTEAS